MFEFLSGVLTLLELVPQEGKLPDVFPKHPSSCWKKIEAFVFLFGS